MTFSATVKNQGNGPTPAGTVIGVGFTLDAQPHPVTWSDTHTAALPAGGSIVLTPNNGLAGTPSWSAVAGTYKVTAWVDDVNRIRESNENNNKLTQTISVKQPDVHINDCREITEPGSYILDKDLSSAGTCILAHDTANVVLDCNHHVINDTSTDAYSHNNVLYVLNVAGYEIRNCIVRSSGAGWRSGGLAISNAPAGNVHDNVFIQGEVIFNTANNTLFSRNHIYDGDFIQWGSSHISITNNVFTLSLFGIEPILQSSNSVGTTISSNVIDGGGFGVDGIYLTYETLR